MHENCIIMRKAHASFLVTSSPLSASFNSQPPSHLREKKETPSPPHSTSFSHSVKLATTLQLRRLSTYHRQRRSLLSLPSESISTSFLLPPVKLGRISSSSPSMSFFNSFASLFTSSSNSSPGSSLAAHARQKSRGRAMRSTDDAFSR